MVDDYFSDREQGPPPRVNEGISVQAWRGISSRVQTLISQGAFGSKFPVICPDGGGIVGTDERNFSGILQAEIPDLFKSPRVQTFDGSPPNINYVLNFNEVPSTLTILDLVEFCYRNVAKPIQGAWHKYYAHYHLTFILEEGQAELKNDINRLFARNGLVYELQDDGQIIRLAPPIIREELQSPIFKTEDAELNRLLEMARIKYLNPDINIRRESLEKLWDAWERLKTLEIPNNKKASIETLLNKASSEPNFRKVLEEDAKKLTSIGNYFQIRHSEVDKIPVMESTQIDYLFHRLFSMINILLRSRNK